MKNKDYSAAEPIADALTPAWLADRLDRVRPGWSDAPCAVAVSGGPDSVALLLLLSEIVKMRGAGLLILHVDHGLRPEAAAEAGQVADLARSLGHPCEILRWTGAKPKAGVQQAAREARLALMLGACRDRGIGSLLLAHHLDDQAETLLHRIDRGTGPDGLAGMEPASIRQGVGLVRPLLAWPKSALEAVAAASGVPVTRDPSNADLRYERSRLRLVSSTLAELGVTPHRLGRLAGAMSGARAQMDRLTGGLVADEAVLQPEGYAALSRPMLSAVPDPVAARVLSGLIQAVGGADYPPAPAAVTRLLLWLRAEDGAPQPGGNPVHASARTLGGCRIAPEAGRVLVHREWRWGEWRRGEWRRSTPPFWVRPGVTALWDGRFEVENRTALPVAVRCAGEAGLAAWRRSTASASRDERVEKSLPGAVRLTLPMIVDLDGALALPHLSEVGADPQGWIGSHVRVRHAPRVVPGWLKSRYRNLSGDRGSVSPPVNGRQAL